MKNLLTLTVASVALLGAMPALAGSVNMPESVEATMAPTPVAADRWAGPYVGAYLGSAYDGDEMMYGLQAGYNLQFGSIVVGGEVDAFKTIDNNTSEVFLNARAGYSIGNKALVFVKAGRGQFEGFIDLNAVGLGAEYAVSDSLSVRFDYELHNTLSSNVFDGPGFAKIGVNWSF